MNHIQTREIYVFNILHISNAMGQHMAWINIITLRLFEEDMSYYQVFLISSIELRESAYRVTMDWECYEANKLYQSLEIA